MNALKATVASNYGRDGFMASSSQGRHAKNYEPNSYDGPVENGRPLSAPLAVRGGGPRPARGLRGLRGLTKTARDSRTARMRGGRRQGAGRPGTVAACEPVRW